MSTTIGRGVNSTSLDEIHTVSEILTSTCLKKRLTYKTTLGQYFTIKPDEFIYKIRNKKYLDKNLDYIIGDEKFFKSLDNETLKNLELIQSSETFDIINFNARYWDRCWGDDFMQTKLCNKKSNAQGWTYITYRFQLPKCPVNYSRAVDTKQTIMWGALFQDNNPQQQDTSINLTSNNIYYTTNPEMWWKEPGYNGKLDWDLNTGTDNLRGGDIEYWKTIGNFTNLNILMCVPNDAPMTRDPEMIETINTFFSNIQLNDVLANWDIIGHAAGGKELDLNIPYQIQTGQYLGIAGAWQNNFNVSQEDILNSKYGHFPCGIQKLDDNTVAACNGNNCNPKNVRFCGPAFKSLQFNTNSLGRQQTLDYGESATIGLCYDPTYTPAQTMCEQHADNTSTISALYSSATNKANANSMDEKYSLRAMILSHIKGHSTFAKILKIAIFNIVITLAASIFGGGAAVLGGGTFISAIDELQMAGEIVVWTAVSAFQEGIIPRSNIKGLGTAFSWGVNAGMLFQMSWHMGFVGKLQDMVDSTRGRIFGRATTDFEGTVGQSTINNIRNEIGYDVLQTNCRKYGMVQATMEEETTVNQIWGVSDNSDLALASEGEWQDIVKMGEVAGEGRDAEHTKLLQQLNDSSTIRLNAIALTERRAIDIVFKAMKDDLAKSENSEILRIIHGSHQGDVVSGEFTISEKGTPDYEWMAEFTGDRRVKKFEEYAGANLVSSPSIPQPTIANGTYPFEIDEYKPIINDLKRTANSITSRKAFYEEMSRVDLQIQESGSVRMKALKEFSKKLLIENNVQLNTARILGTASMILEQASLILEDNAYVTDDVRDNFFKIAKERSEGESLTRVVMARKLHGLTDSDEYWNIMRKEFDSLYNGMRGQKTLMTNVVDELKEHTQMQSKIYNIYRWMNIYAKAGIETASEENIISMYYQANWSNYTDLTLNARNQQEVQAIVRKAAEERAIANSWQALGTVQAGSAESWYVRRNNYLNDKINLIYDGQFKLEKLFKEAGVEEDTIWDTMCDECRAQARNLDVFVRDGGIPDLNSPKTCMASAVQLRTMYNMDKSTANLDVIAREMILKKVGQDAFTGEEIRTIINTMKTAENPEEIDNIVCDSYRELPTEIQATYASIVGHINSHFRMLGKVDLQMQSSMPAVLNGIMDYFDGATLKNTGWFKEAEFIFSLDDATDIIKRNDDLGAVDLPEGYPTSADFSPFGARLPNRKLLYFDQYREPEEEYGRGWGGSIHNRRYIEQVAPLYHALMREAMPVAIRLDNIVVATSDIIASLNVEDWNDVGRQGIWKLDEKEASELIKANISKYNAPELVSVDSARDIIAKKLEENPQARKFLDSYNSQTVFKKNMQQVKTNFINELNKELWGGKGVGWVEAFGKQMEEASDIQMQNTILKDAMKKWEFSQINSHVGMGGLELGELLETTTKSNSKSYTTLLESSVSTLTETFGKEASWEDVVSLMANGQDGFQGAAVMKQLQKEFGEVASLSIGPILSGEELFSISSILDGWNGTRDIDTPTRLRELYTNNNMKELYLAQCRLVDSVLSDMAKQYDIATSADIVTQQKDAELKDTLFTKLMHDSKSTVTNDTKDIVDAALDNTEKILEMKTIPERPPITIGPNGTDVTIPPPSRETVMEAMNKEGIFYNTCEVGEGAGDSDDPACSALNGIVNDYQDIIADKFSQIEVEPGMIRELANKYTNGLLSETDISTTQEYKKILEGTTNVTEGLQPFDKIESTRYINRYLQATNIKRAIVPMFMSVSLVGLIEWAKWFSKHPNKYPSNSTIISDDNLQDDNLQDDNLPDDIESKFPSWYLSRINTIRTNLYNNYRVLSRAIRTNTSMLNEHLTVLQEAQVIALAKQDRQNMSNLTTIHKNYENRIVQTYTMFTENDTKAYQTYISLDICKNIFTHKEGQPVHISELNNIKYNLYANKIENQVLEYDTTNKFVNPFYRHLKSKHITLFSDSTSAAFKTLADLHGFDMPFNPSRSSQVTGYDAENIGIKYDGSFVGGHDNINLSDEWWKYHNKSDVSPVFNNKYLQYYAFAHSVKKPITTCASFCNLLGTELNTEDQSFNDLAKMYNSTCQKAHYEDEKSTCNLCSNDDTCLKYSSENCYNSDKTLDVSFIQKCPVTCSDITNCNSSDAYYISDDNSYVSIECHNINNPEDAQTCAKTCRNCNNLLNTCNCVAKSPTPVQTIYKNSTVDLDFSLKTYLATTWEAQGKNVWWYKETGREPSCTCSGQHSDEEIKAKCKLCGDFYISDCCGVLTDTRAIKKFSEISNNVFLITNYYYTNKSGIEASGGPFYSCIFDSSNLQFKRSYATCSNETGRPSWNKNCLKTFSGRPIISHGSIAISEQGTNNNILLISPQDCNQFCTMKSMLFNSQYGLNTPITPYGIESNNLSVCRCTTQPSNCQACINKLSDDRTPITDCNTYCNAIYPGESQRLDYIVTGECGNSAGTSIDSKTNCCNCYMYDTIKRQSRLLVKHKTKECNKCGILGGRVTDCSTLDVSSGYHCIDFHTNYNGLNYQCRNDRVTIDGKIKCKKHTKHCDGSSNYLRGCYNNLIQESRPVNFALNSKNISKNAPSDPTHYHHYSCTSKEPTKLTSLHCEYFCHPNKPYLSDTSCHELCTCTDLSKTYSERPTCNGIPVPHLSGPDFDCSYMYTMGVLNNNINLDGYFAQDLDISFGFRQCLITPSGKRVASNNLCKVPDRVDDVEIPILPQGGGSDAPQADYLHHSCLCSYSSQGTKSCKVNTLKWTDRTFAIESKLQGYNDRPIDIINKFGYRGSHCETLPIPPPKPIAIQGICAKDVSNAFRPDEDGTISCNVKEDCSGYSKKWDGSYNCYRQGGYFCSSGNINTREEMCRTSFKNSPIIITENNDSDVTVICRDPSSIMVSCSEPLPVPPTPITEGSSVPISTILPDCCGTTWYHSSGDSDLLSVGLNKYLTPQMLYGFDDDCDSLTKTMINQPGINDGSLCPGYIKLNEQTSSDYGATGAQCHWNNDLSKCVIALNSSLNTLMYCRAIPKPLCTSSFYGASYNLDSDLSYCKTISLSPLPDCSYAQPRLAFNGMPQSICAGYTLSGNIPHQCVFNYDLSKCDISSSIYSDKKHCTLPLKKTYLGYSDNPTICQEAKPVQTHKGLRCLAYYSLPDVKPRGYSFNSTLLSARCQVPAYLAMDPSIGHTTYLGFGEGKSNLEQFNILDKECSNNSTCNGYVWWTGPSWEGFKHNAKYRCMYTPSGNENHRCRLTNKNPCHRPELSSTYVDVSPYNQDNIWVDFFTINSHYYNYATHTIDISGIDVSEGKMFRKDCAQKCLDNNACQGFLFSPPKHTCKLHIDNSYAPILHGRSTINIRYEKNDLSASYYSKYPTIWVSKEVSNSFAPYHYTRDTPGAPYHTGQTCNEIPDVNNNCRPMKSFIIANDFCKTEHPLDLVERTSILTSPTPAPLSNEDMFNDLPLVYNLTPFISGSKSSNNLNKGWLENKCALASIEDTIGWNYHFDTKTDCEDAQLVDTEDKCTRSWGQKCHMPEWNDNEVRCNPGQGTWNIPPEQHSIPCNTIDDCVTEYNKNGYGLGKIESKMVSCNNNLCKLNSPYNSTSYVNSFNSCGTGHMCYATNKENRIAGNPAVECSKSDPKFSEKLECRCLPISASTYSGTFIPDSSNLSSNPSENIMNTPFLDCNTYCNEGIGVGGVQGSKCLHANNNSNGESQKRSCKQSFPTTQLISVQGDTNKIDTTCTCVRHLDWITSLDKILSYDSSYTKSVGMTLNDGEFCAKGLISHPVDPQNAPGNLVKDSLDNICIPDYSKGRTPDEQNAIMFPSMLSFSSRPPQRANTKDIPLLHQRTCGTDGVYSAPKLYNNTTQTCCAGKLNYLTYGKYTRCCGTTVIDNRFHYCYNNAPKTTLIEDEQNNKQIIDCSRNLLWDLSHGYYFKQSLSSNNQHDCTN